MRGLLAKALREVWLATLLMGAGLSLIVAMITYVLPQIQGEVGRVWMQIPIAKMMLTALLGTDLDDITAQTLHAMVWVHPMVLTLVWGHAIVICTRMPAGEIDRGTIDMLLGLPVSRRTVYACESAVWLASGIFIILMAWIGYSLSARGMPPTDRPEPVRILLVLANLILLYIAVGGAAYLVSALSDRRGRAIAIVLGLLIASFLLNFLAAFWEPAQRLSFLSVLDYYRPAHVFRDGRLPAGDLGVLLLVGGAGWLLGGEILARRSICTV